MSQQQAVREHLFVWNGWSGGDVTMLKPFQQAWLDFQAALAAYHGAEQNEAQVAHWVLEGSATFADLRAARERTVAARSVKNAARARYTRRSISSAMEAGKLAARRGGI